MRTPPGRIVDGPEWVESLRFNIDGRAPQNASGEQIGEMARRLLADRFRLELRSETRSLDVYALVIARSDEKLGEGIRPAVECDSGPATPRPPASARPACQLTASFKDGVPVLIGGASSIEELINWLQIRVDRPIVDRTGLKEKFAVTFAIPPAAPLQARPVTDGLPSVSPELSTAIREQLGLNLVPRKEPTPVLAITHVEKPTPD